MGELGKKQKEESLTGKIWTKERVARPVPRIENSAPHQGADITKFASKDIFGTTI